MSESLQRATLTSETRVATVQENIHELKSIGYLGERSTEVMNRLLSQIPELKKYIGTTIAGSGWGIYPVCTLTFAGIQKTLDLLKINATVANSLKEIQNLVPKENGRRIIVADKGHLTDGTTYNHAIVLYIEKTSEGFIVIVDDCSKIYVEADNKEIKKLFPTSAKVVQVYCDFKRQSYGKGNACSSFAINTAAALDQNPNLIKEIFKRNRVQSSNDNPQLVTVLPHSIAHFDLSKANAQQIRFQAMVVESLIGLDVLEEFVVEKAPIGKKTCMKIFLDTINGVVRRIKG